MANLVWAKAALGYSAHGAVKSYRIYRTKLDGHEAVYVLDIDSQAGAGWIHQLGKGGKRYSSSVLQSVKNKAQTIEAGPRVRRSGNSKRWKNRLTIDQITGCDLSFKHLTYQPVGDVSNINLLQGLLDCSKWTDLDLMPVVHHPKLDELMIGRYSGQPPTLRLVWKHVRPSPEYNLKPDRWIGNLQFTYRVWEPYTCLSMTTAGPIGALRDWSFDSRQPEYVMAIAGICSSYLIEQGVYYALFGIPMAVYKCALVGEEILMELVDGEDVKHLID